MTGFRWEIIQEYAPLFAEGAWMTIKCTIICVILGTLWGLTLGLGGWQRQKTARGASCCVILCSGQYAST